METIERWRAAGERGDAQASVACVSDDVVLISPLTDQFRFEGRDVVLGLLRAAFTQISDIQFHTAVGDGDTCALFYRATVAGQRLEEAQLLRLDESAQICDITLFMRPLPATVALMNGLGPALARADRRPALARLLGAATAPLAFMTRLGDKHIVPLARPDRRAE